MPDSTIAGLPAVANLAADDQFAIERPAPANANHHVTAQQISDFAYDQVVKMFVIPYCGYTGMTYVGPGQLLGAADWGVPLEDAADHFAWGRFQVPSDFGSAMTVTAVVISEATANAYVQQGANYGGCGQDYATHSNGTGILQVVAVTKDFNNCILQFSLASAVVNDIVSLWFRREAIDALDTVNADCGLAGWVIEYQRKQPA